MGAFCLSSLPAAAFQAAFDYVRSLPPFSVDFRSVHRTSDYCGAAGGDAQQGVLWAQREFPDSSFEICDGAELPLRAMCERFARAVGECPGIVGLMKGDEYVGYQRYTFYGNHQDSLQLSMDYVYVNPDRRGCGFRDRMQACLFGAALLLAGEREKSLTLSFRQVKNPNNIERYLLSGFEEVVERIEDDEDDEVVPFAYFSPVPRGPQPPSSYQKVYFSGGLLALLHRSMLGA
jgi:hypothetical protein